VSPLHDRASRLSRAKRRAGLRRRDAGAIMFVIAITLALLGAMGMYALNVASTEVKSAGLVRQQTQTHYLAALGVLAGAQDVSANRAQMYYTALTTPFQSGILSSDTNCVSLYGETTAGGASTIALGCRRVGSAELTANWAVISPTPPGGPLITPWTSNATDVGRGTSGLPTTPDFFIEVTDAAQGPMPWGYSTNQNLCFAEFTVTSYGLTPTTDATGPASPWTGAGNPYSYQSEGLESARARIIGGPITCPSPGG